MKKLTTYFFQGILFLTPVFATIYIVYFIFSEVDQIFGFTIPGLGFLLAVALITTTGFLVSTFLARGAANFIDTLFRRMPIVKMIYIAIKDLVNAFVGEQKRFDSPVLVTLIPGCTLHIIGFVTRTSLANIGKMDSIAVYVPQSYNFAGNLFIVGKEQITPLNIESAKVMAFIVSGGVSGL
ncbi:MAG: DUF502 domain-containing protein [Nitrospirota bacterium]